MKMVSTPARWLMDLKSKDKWASYNAIKEIFAPLAFDINSISPSFNGVINVENKFLYTNLNRLKFSWKLILFPKATQKTLEPLIIEEGKLESPYAGPAVKRPAEIYILTTLYLLQAFCN